MLKNRKSMMELSNIKFTADEILEIDSAYNFYRNSDLELLAKRYETDILNGKFSIVSLIPTSPDISSFNDIQRVSVNKFIREDKTNNRLFHLEDLKYPPSKVLNKLYYNRASYKNQSIFYGGFGKLQALFENSPNLGDLYTVSTWRQKKNTELCYVSIFHDEKVKSSSTIFEKDWNHYVDQLEKLDEETGKALEKLFALITFFFIRPVDKSKKIEYLFSSYIANKIFETNHSPKIEAILYPSVPMEFIAVNLAIKPEAFDRKFDFVKAEEFIVIDKTQGRRQWGSHKIAEAVNHKNGKLQWENDYIGDSLLRFMKNYNVDLNEK